LSLDLEYLERISLVGDIKIVGKTVIKVLKRDGVATEGMETAEDLGDYLLRMGSIDEKRYLEQINESNKWMACSRESI